MISSRSETLLGWAAMILLIAVFLVLRVPVLIHAPGGQDEQFFAVPGYTISREGIPRIPYAPTRQRQSLFQDSDRCLMALPPALFYVQAPFFWVFPAGYPTGRAPLLLGGVVAIILAARFVRVAGGNWTGGLLAACGLALSRPLLFTSTMARPDLLCMVCGWLAILVLWSTSSSSGWKNYALAGMLAGLGALFHPFALVFCIQCGVWSLLAPGAVRTRFLRAAVLTVAALLTMCLWLPLILAYREEFFNQFTANVLEKAGPGLFSRILFPVDSLKHHARLVWEFMGPIQTGLFTIGACSGLSILFLRRDPNRIRWLMLILSSMYLTATVAGIHPTKGYWVYAFLLVTSLIGVVISPWLALVVNGDYRLSMARTTLTVVLTASVMTPGGGLKSSIVYLSHWGDPAYHAGRFIRGVLKDLPKDGIVYADSAYVFDVYLSGRETRLCQPRKLYWGDETLTYSYILVAADAAQYGHPVDYGAVLSNTIGSRELPFSCYVDVYVPRSESP